MRDAWMRMRIQFRSIFKIKRTHTYILGMSTADKIDARRRAAITIVRRRAAFTIVRHRAANTVADYRFSKGT